MLMKRLVFPISCLLWLADMILLAFMAPVGKHLYPAAVLYAAGFILLLSMVKSLPAGWRPAMAFGFIIGLGILARLFFVSYPPGNDIYRYIWEGWIQTQGINPYSFAPDSAILKIQVPEPLVAIWRQVNHKELAAAYPPMAMLLFRTLAAMHPSVLTFKLAVLFFDVGLMLVLAKMIGRRCLSPRRLLFYAANPLVLVFVTGEGHLDVVQAFFLCLGLMLMRMPRQSWGFLALGLSAATKYLAAIAVPFCLRASNVGKCAVLLIPLLFFVPYLDAGSHLFHSIGIFVSDMHYNDALTSLARFMFKATAPVPWLLFLFGCLTLVFLLEQDRLRSVYLAIGCLLLFLPTLHPWYLVLITPFLCFFPSRAWLYLHAAMVFTFPVLGIEYQTAVFQEIHWIKWIEYLPFFLLLAIGMARDGYIFRERRFRAPETISVIVPAYNEAARIHRCVSALLDRPLVKEIIVADGGSIDNTRGIAARLGATVVTSRRGRGIQIRTGADAASGDVLLVLHADCKLEKGGCRKIIERLTAEPAAIGGAFGMRYAERRPSTRCISFLNNLRAAATGISFGDQAQFVRSGALRLMGGFPALYLMEDVELSLQMKTIGRVLYLGRGVRVSSRRWRRQTVVSNIMTVLRLCCCYLVERRWRPEGISDRRYYERYYERMRRNV
jgi:rSAM/selenodomain-associated transferase 2